MDKLALVSKLLLDERVVELRNENERLRKEFEDFKLKFAVLIYDHGRLTYLMELVNLHDGCRCNRCPQLDKENFQALPEVECKFFPWFETVLAKFGLKMQWTPDDGNWTTSDEVQIVYNRDEKCVWYSGPLRSSNPNEEEFNEEYKKIIKLCEYLEMTDSIRDPQ